MVAQRGRPRKIVWTEHEKLILKESITMFDPSLPKVHHILRYLSKTGATIPQGAFSIADTDAYIGEWLDKGYELFNTHFVDQNPEGFGLLYVLVRKE
jgi:hypothetical protein